MNKYKFKNLIFCGGGIKLYTFIGAIKVLEENDILSNITTYIGTSIGGLISALLNINYTHSELYKFIESFNLNEIIDIDISNLYTNNYGLDNGDKIEKFIRILFKAKIERSNITFKELYDLTNKHLIISATCLTTRKIVYFDHKNYPDLDVIDGIRMAITIPLFFTYKRYNDQIYVDGGILDQFPIHLLKESTLEETLGLKLGNINRNISYNIDSLQSYFQNIIRCMVEEIELLRYDDKYNQNIITFENTISAIDVDINLNKKKQLYNDGIIKTTTFLKNYDNNITTQISNNENQKEKCDKKTQISNSEDLKEKSNKKIQISFNEIIKEKSDKSTQIYIN